VKTGREGKTGIGMTGMTGKEGTGNEKLVPFSCSYLLSVINKQAIKL